METLENPSFLAELTAIKFLICYYCLDSNKKSYLQRCWEDFSSLCELDLKGVATIQQRLLIIDQALQSLQVLTQAMCSASEIGGRKMSILRQWALQLNERISSAEYKQTICIEYVKSLAQSINPLFTRRALLNAAPTKGMIFDKICTN